MQRGIIDCNITSTVSEETFMKYGVSPRSILETILFIIFIINLTSVILSDQNTSMVKYANDTSFVLKADILPQITRISSFRLITSSSPTNYVYM